MARSRDPFTQALSSLTERILSGTIPGGVPVIVQDEARRLQLSTTPVREALAQLSGEGLVERAASGGYVTMRLDAQGVRDRYALQSECLRFAIRLGREAMLGGPMPPGILEALASPPSASALFDAVIGSAGNPVLAKAALRVGRQLRRLSAVEPLVFPDMEIEVRDLRRICLDGFDTGFAEASDRFHERRMAAAGLLAALAMRPPETDPSAQGSFRALQIESDAAPRKADL